MPTDPNQTLLAVWLAAQDELRRLVDALGVGRDRVDAVLEDVYLAANAAYSTTTFDETIAGASRHTWPSAWPL